MSKIFLLLTVLVSILFFAPASQASNLDFNFNTLADGNNNAAVQQYMNNIINAIHPGGSVVVSGAKAEKNYTGDNHVVGPVSGTTVTPLTLGNTDGGIQHPMPWDAYLINSGTDRITMTFSFPIYFVSFDYEIFPDGTCPKQSANCTPTSSNWPDFTFEADDTVKFKKLSIDPSVSGPYSHSPLSGAANSELAPQYLGTSGQWFFPAGIHKLEFIDWPTTIGIDNLKLQDTPAVPEPGSLFLLASGLLGFIGFKKHKFIS